MLNFVRELNRRAAIHKLGPGLITGAVDDDPSGIVMSSQAGAKVCFSMQWTLVFSVHRVCWHVAIEVLLMVVTKLAGSAAYAVAEPGGLPPGSSQWP